ncbi:MAG TPA: gamma-glutamyltransferase [Xanthobacteraceae bacterium]|jgi:gamma-glutamyltranspeptidase/glutathione hydrolase|nr:gamma-glutamyltransferase [Xanthobacteraceae bacterium]
MTPYLRLTRRALAAMVWCLAALASAGAQERATAPSTAAPPLRIEAVTARNGMVVAQEKRASRIGVEILEKGGNAIDAAVAVGFALAVTLPKAGNLGGGGLMLVHLAEHNEDVAIDYRETAPRDTPPDVFLDPNGAADPAKSRESGLGVGVPGTVAGLAVALDRYGSGKFTLADLIAPALALARDGIPIEDDLVDSLLLAQPRLARWPSSARIFLKADGTALGPGDRLVQADLAASLEAIARDGARAFYTGPIADQIVAAVRGAGGRMTRGDLEGYAPMLREPVRDTYRGYEIVSMPPPSSGGVHLIEMLNILEGFPPQEVASASPATLHLMIEAMKLAYADRAEYLGDSDAVDVPIEHLTSKDYAATLRAGIDPKKARLSVDIRAGEAPASSGGNTTHVSIVDRDGNAVANTTSLNFNYGLGLVAGESGILLNNTLDDFAAKPGAPNAFGLTGGAANAPGPNKRPLSSMTPTIVLKDGAPAFVTGAPGGSRIITSVLQVLVNAIDFKKPIAEAVAAPRVHHQWLPDEVVVERTLAADTVRALTARGHKVRVGPTSGSANSIAVTPAGLVGAADTRAKGALAAGY